ncbi:MAG: hydroxymethylpyrimidine/phosphomethylpyrimidine kinase [Thermodesulfobacteria bacterium]|nr:hydroxymethylpyrimidine/phosphomethylpyrimidine kinase [Thermodesulfobacteriota bacterium]
MEALSIAGLDPSGGAGILMDVKVFTLLGIRSSAVPTTLTIQTPFKFVDWVPISSLYLYNTLNALGSDINFLGIKIGMIGSEENIKIIAEFLKKQKTHKNWIVLDPVLKATLGKKLFSGKNFIDSLKTQLLPLIDVITPNLEELIKITEEKDITSGVKKLFEFGINRGVIVTGIKEKNKVKDLLFTKEGEVIQISKERLNAEFHGTGCAFSSALLSFLIKGLPLEKAFKKAKNWLYLYLRCSLKKTEAGGGLWVFL